MLGSRHQLGLMIHRTEPAPELAHATDTEQDLRCPIGQAEEFFRTPTILGKKNVEMVRFIGESHGLSRGGSPQNRAERLRRILGWFKRYGGR